MIKDMVMGPIIQLISDSYNLIKNRERWTQDFFQRDRDGNKCSWKDGYSFCSMGAIHFAYYNRNPNSKSTLINIESDLENAYHYAVCLIQTFSEKMFEGKSIYDVNDDSSEEAHRNVLSVFEAILNEFRDREPTEEECLGDRKVFKKNQYKGKS